MSEQQQQQPNREIEVTKLQIRLDLAEQWRKAAGWLVHSTDNTLADTRSLMTRAVSPDDAMDAALAVLDAAKQVKRASAILGRAEQEVARIRVQLATAERVAAKYAEGGGGSGSGGVLIVSGSTVLATPADGGGDEPTA